MNILLDQRRITTCLERLPAMKQDILAGTSPLARELPFLQSGINRLTFETAVNYVRQFLLWEKREAADSPCTLLYLETRFECDLPLGKRKLKLRGMIDRIDRRGSEVRIIDYKTGSVNQADVSAPTDSEGFMQARKFKSRQLVMYDLMTQGFSWRENTDVICGMISLRKLSQGMVSANSIDKQPAPVSDEQKSAFLQALQVLVDAMLDPDRTWTHEPDSDYCAYCQS